MFLCDIGFKQGIPSQTNIIMVRSLYLYFDIISNFQIHDYLNILFHLLSFDYLNAFYQFYFTDYNIILGMSFKPFDLEQLLSFAWCSCSRDNMKSDREDSWKGQHDSKMHKNSIFYIDPFMNNFKELKVPNFIVWFKPNCRRLLFICTILEILFSSYL